MQNLLPALNLLRCRGLARYILFGDETYYEIFKLQYDAVMSSLRQGPFIFHANMHRPNIVVRKHLDSLQMFWPGLQVCVRLFLSSALCDDPERSVGSHSGRHLGP